MEPWQALSPEGSAMSEDLPQPQPALVRSAQAGDAGVLAEELAAGADLEARGWGGLTALAAAAAAGHVDAVRALLAAGADREAQTSRRWRPLHLAAAAGHPIVVLALLAAGAEVDALGGSAVQPEAAEEQEVEGPQPSLALTPLHLAVRAGHAEVVQALTFGGANANLHCDGWVPLHTAAQQGDVKVVEALLAAGCQREATTERGSTALHLAAHEGHLAVVRRLLAAGGDRSARDWHGRLAVHRAAIGGYMAVVRELQEDINAVDNQGQTCLHYFIDGAVRYHAGGPTARRLLAELLAAGADTAAASQTYPTPLDLLLLGHAAAELSDAQQDAPELIRMLVAAGCPADTEGALPALGGDANAQPRRSSLLEWLHHIVEEAEQWPQQLGATALAMTRALLQCAAAERPQGRPAILWTAIYSGSLELVRLVLEAYPGRPREWCRGEGGLRAVEVALQCLVTELERPVAAGLAPRQWEQHYTPLVLHTCQLVELLLAAGCPPVPRLVLRATQAPLSRPAASGATVLELPWWCCRALSFLPLLAGGVEWSPEAHAAFPPAFRRAARQLLLINERRGFGGAAQLSRDVLFRVLALAARPLPAWVPQLQPFVAGGG